MITEMVKITTYDKFFYKIDSGDFCKLILESNLDKTDLFLDIIELLDDYSEFISKIIIHKFDQNLSHINKDIFRFDYCRKII